MQFQVNGQDYFLNFVEDEERWLVFMPTDTGVNRIPVYVDGSNVDETNVYETNDERIGVPKKDRHNRPN